MRNKIATLLLYASGVPRWEQVLVDTLAASLGLRNVLQRVAAISPRRFSQNRFFHSLLSIGYCSLSYVNDWLETFQQTSLLEVTECNINNFLEYRACLKRLKDFELIIILHSAAGDNMTFLRYAASKLQARRGRLLVFFGNEYNLMPEKIGFAREVEAEYIASQLPETAAEWLYSDCKKSKVLLAPPALNPSQYKPIGSVRSTDIGYRGDVYGFSLGDNERTEFILFVKAHAEQWGLTSDIQFVRHPRDEWIRFLNRCKAVVGAESGTYYLEKTDQTQSAVIQYLLQHPKASFPEIHSQFFSNYVNPISGKAISSRHFEPIGTKTCQILIEGYYNGILVAGEHYIGVKKDLSNLAEAIHLFKDEKCRGDIVDRSYEYALDQHTYRHRIDFLLKQVM